MSRQVQVGHLDGDEQDVVRQLEKICSWRCLPRHFPTAIVEPMPLGSLANKDQIIFPEVFSEVVLDNIVKVLPSTWSAEEESVARYFVHPRAFAFIEWGRCPQVNGTVAKGRFFLNCGHENTAPPAQASLLGRLMNSLMDGLKKHSPYKVMYKSPIYIGTHLAGAVKSGTIERVGDLAGSMVTNLRTRGHA